MKILNFGSLNIDYTYNVDHILIGGETLSASDRNVYAGGKGLNQSLALARAGIDVWHAGAIGKRDGKILLDTLKANYVHTDYLKILENDPSGHTFIQVDKNGQNCILVYGGSNQMITSGQVDQTLKHFNKDDFILLQNEINKVSYIMEKAHEKEMKIVFNPSPFDEKIKNLPLEYVDFFLINEIEAAGLANGKSDSELLDHLVQRFPNSHFIMTVGSKGAYFAYQNIRKHQGVYDVKVVDTTAAGDTFTGYFLKSYLDGKSPQSCLKIASAASAIAVSKAGASTSIPNEQEVKEFLQTMK